MSKKTKVKEGASRVVLGKYSDGFSDKLRPMKPLDLSKVNTVNDLVLQMKDTALTARQIGEAADNLYAMVTDPDCFVVGTFAGVMTMAKMGLLICDMIDRNMIQAVVTTGALNCHGFAESAGMTQFKADNRFTDEQLYYKGYNRIYDTIELEKNLDDTEEILNEILDKYDTKKTLCSWELNKLLGKYLADNIAGRAILKSAFLKNVPVFIPAFTDSEMGLDFALYNRKLAAKGKPQISYNPFIDLEKYTDLVFRSKRIGIFTIGGGVPRNWAQQVACYLDVVRWRFKEAKTAGGAGADPFFKRFTYGVRICPEPVHLGSLSGCTYSEGVSWGKLTPVSEGGKHSEVLAEATLAWPLVLKAVMERLDAKGIIIKKNFQHEY